MGRLTDNDRQFGPITYGKSGWSPWRLVWSSGGDEDPGNTLTAYAFGWVARIKLPNLLRPLRIKQHATYWDAATVKRLGRNWYYEVFPREYGFSLSDGDGSGTFFQLFFGAQTHDSATTQSWSCFLPWTQWRHVRYSLYDTEGRHFWTAPEGRTLWEVQRRMQEDVPKAMFEIEDYDGQRIKATTYIEEREWRFGTGWFKWLSLFRKSKVRRSLDIRFSAEVGPDKGSWKGGTLGHGIEMLPGELHEAAFSRYCEQEQRARYNNKYRLRFVAARV